MDLQARKDELSKRLNDLQAERERCRVTFTQLTSQVDQVVGALWAIDQMIADNGAQEHLDG